jgi:dCTP deaminase
MSVIVGTALKDLVENQAIISPILDPAQLGHGSVDVRLGSYFLLSDKTREVCIDSHRPMLEQPAQRHVYVRIGDYFVLHPGGFALAVTLEYVKLPDNAFALVEGRSSVGRTGLLIATASLIHPNYAGCPTLELVNAGEIPLRVYPGDLIGQLVLLETSPVRAIASAAEQPKFTLSRYRVAVEPELSKWHKDMSRDRLLRSRLFAADASATVLRAGP